MELKMISIKDIVTNPLQPRQEFNREKLQELADSIKEGELLQPIVVRKQKDKYEIVAGERRFKAFQILKEPKIPAIVRKIKDDTDALEKSLIENWQRADLTSDERENALEQLWKSDRYKTKEELATKLGIGSARIVHILKAKEFRNKHNVRSAISTRTIEDTEGLKDDTRKKILKAVEENKRRLEEGTHNFAKEFGENNYNNDEIIDVEEPEPDEDKLEINDFININNMFRLLRMQYYSSLSMNSWIALILSGVYLPMMIR